MYIYVPSFLKERFLKDISKILALKINIFYLQGLFSPKLVFKGVKNIILSFKTFKYLNNYFFCEKCSPFTIFFCHVYSPSPMKTLQTFFLSP